jgi:hypothetical protein
MLLFGLVVPTLVRAADPWTVAEDLGRAYAKDAGVEYGGVTHDAGTTVTEDSLAASRKELIDALTVGYAPPGKKFLAIPFAKIRDILEVTTAAGSPEDTCRAVVQPRTRIIHRTFKFGGTSVPGVLILNSAGLVAYDSLLSLPALRVPFLEVPPK